MNKHVIAICMCLLVVTSVAAQEFVGTIGISMQSLKELKAYQSSVINNMTIPLKTTQSFPNFLQYQLGLRFLVTPKIKIGGTVYLTSTAARSAASDYSGEMTIDQKLSCVGGGGFFSYVLVQKERWNLAPYAIMGINYSHLSMITNIDVTGVERSRDESKFNALSSMFEAGLEFQYNLNDRLTVHANAGGHLSSSEKLTDDYGDEMGIVNWSGAKVMTGICYRF